VSQRPCPLAQPLLEGGVVVDPAPVLKAALPDKAIKLRQWGLRYFNTDWTRYQVILDADIGTGKTRVKCRGVSSDTPVGAPTLKELKANNGALLKDVWRDFLLSRPIDIRKPLQNFFKR